MHFMDACGVAVFAAHHLFAEHGLLGMVVCCAWFARHDCCYEVIVGMMGCLW